uniref:Uncharacterized protein n=1 Tax=Rangifer tarandus platyrhynchus TaxID=3082113 RepID=A0ACB0ERS6_RANTA|nr:unnamed protein product [Rangifer tarandus platyrhynchus]
MPALPSSARCQEEHRVTPGSRPHPGRGAPLVSHGRQGGRAPGGGGARPGPWVLEGLGRATGERSLDSDVESSWKQGRGPGSPPAGSPPELAGGEGGSPRAPGAPLPHPGSPPSAGQAGRREGSEPRRGPGPGRGPSGLYHGGGGGGGGGGAPGVCGSPPRSRARRFHFPGCPRVNIRVSAPSPRAEPPPPPPSFLPRPGPARARPPRSRLSANERARPRRSPSMESGAGGRGTEPGREGRALRRAGPSKGRGLRAGMRKALGPRSVSNHPHPQPAARSRPCGAPGTGAAGRAGPARGRSGARDPRVQPPNCRFLLRVGPAASRCENGASGHVPL